MKFCIRPIELIIPILTENFTLEKRNKEPMYENTENL